MFGPNLEGNLRDIVRAFKLVAKDTYKEYLESAGGLRM